MTENGDEIKVMKQWLQPFTIGNMAFSFLGRHPGLSGIFRACFPPVMLLHNKRTPDWAGVTANGAEVTVMKQWLQPFTIGNMAFSFLGRHPG